MSSPTQLQQIFNEIQTCTPREYAERIERSLGLVAADDSFAAILHTLLSCKRGALPGRVSHFVRRIFEELREAHPGILGNTFRYLLDFTGSKNAKCRRHALRLLHTMLCVDRMDLSVEVLQTLSERLFDREVSVRKEAIRICLLYQESGLGGSLRLVDVLKDVIRFEQSHEIRRMGLGELLVTPATVNCIIERCVDVNVGVRKVFWTVCFKRLALRDISAAKRIYLMKSAFVEREFDAKAIFLQAMRGFSLEEFAEYFYCREDVFDRVAEVYLASTSEEYRLVKYTPGYVHLMCVYYRFREEADGRDSLCLEDIGEFLGTLHTRCVSLEERIQGAAADQRDPGLADEVEVIVGLFRLLAFYDLFDEPSRKLVLRIISHLLTRCSVKEVVEESVVLCKRIWSGDMLAFLGTIIKRIRGTPLCYAVSECIMKHLPYSELHEAIFQEIAILNLNDSIEIIYWYFYLRPSKSLEELFLSFLPSKRALEGAVDLVLSNMIEVSAIEPCVLSQIAKFDENAVIPAAKLLLAKKTASGDLFRHLLLIFYSSDTERIQQYLTIFFSEYLVHSSVPMVEAYCDVMQLITDNHKIFVDQALYWIANSSTRNGSQRLFFAVCIFIHNNYDSLKNRRFLFLTLESIVVVPCWDPVLTKKIIHLLTLIIRRRPRENAQALLTKLIEIDDGLPLDGDEFRALRGMLG